jgi:hypothetical protein
MALKKIIGFVLLVVFLTAKLGPLFPYLKQLPQVTKNLVANISAIITDGSPVDLLAHTEPCSAGINDDKTDEKEGIKSSKEECEMATQLSISFASISSGSTRTLFLLYVTGKLRNHVNEVFRPPLT